MLAGDASLPEEIAGPQYSNNRLFALFGNYRKLDLAFLDVRNGVGRVTLGEDYSILLVSSPLSASARLGQKQLGIKLR